jgi:choline kinase
MKYVIMADGQGKRWNNHKGTPKHFIKVDGETLIARTVRLLNEYDKEGQVIITSHDKRYEIDGATRYEPLNNVMEIDRFTDELIDKSVCFLYGDTYYCEDSIKTIVETDADDLLFFGNDEKIFAVKVGNPETMHFHIDRVKKLYNEGKIKQCIGWQLYQSFANLPFDEKRIGDKFVKIVDNTCDFNSPDDYDEFEANKQ